METTDPNQAEFLWLLVGRSGPMVRIHGSAAHLCCFEDPGQAESAAFRAENSREPVRYDIAKADVQRAASLAAETGLAGLAIRCADGDWKLWTTGGGSRRMRAARRMSA